MVFSIEMMFCVHNSSHGFIFVYIREPQMDIHCTQEFSEYSVVYTRIQSAFLCDLIGLLLCTQKYMLECCEGKSTSTVLLCKLWRH